MWCVADENIKTRKKSRCLFGRYPVLAVPFGRYAVLTVVFIRYAVLTVVFIRYES